jgi:hypothetical protein
MMMIGDIVMTTMNNTKKIGEKLFGYKDISFKQEEENLNN